MSHQHVQRFALIREDYDTALATLRYVDQNWSTLSEFHSTPLAQRHVKNALDRLDATFVIRVFAEFEQILRDSGEAMTPQIRVYTVRRLIERIALRVGVPDAIRDEAQTVREYRNLLVHSSGATPLLTFREAVAAMNRFLAVLP